MEIGKNKFVTLTYQLRLNSAEGDLIEETNKENPLQFVFGAGRMIEMFEKNLDGLKTGDEFAFGLKADEAYGQVNKDAVVDLPKNIFEVNGTVDEQMLTVGNTIPMQDAQGNRLNGTVLEVVDEAVKMDFNHPLAGDDLHFTGSVVEVREATPEELAAVGGCESGDCDDGSCSSC
ncbi:FKBP-type peptidyl-prolyl cis-trans isomerase [Marinilabiliaceae bacterium ANBcel2]|nr:FKBP-type peptidyl-prolyl cis-trans isomerase [Marinilabiliaceae bacterium ANBcel2]